jgi:hypothetical protein
LKFEISLTNETEAPIQIQFPSGQLFEIIVRDEASNVVYQYSSGKMFTMAIVEKVIEPSETLIWTDEWDMKVNGEIINPGTYFVTAQLQINEVNGESVDREEFTIEKKITI